MSDMARIAKVLREVLPDRHTYEVVVEILMERVKQDSRWGVQNHNPADWLTILGEEYGEACKAALEARFPHYAKCDYGKYRHELVQVAAVALAMIECLDRNKGRSKGEE